MGWDFSGGVEIQFDCLRLFQCWLSNFHREGEEGKNFSGRLRFFREGFKLFLEGWNWDFLMGEFLRLLQGS